MLRSTANEPSGIHSITPGGGDGSTYGYYDGPGYMIQACFQFTSWSGAAVHCSPAI
ncbi:hypothetical protein [Streptomyces sp. ICBB 8177]|uniref:hypothetical protein n=1 Tax=Streptomyces sp. ICBB 8177 TaxID=563922 RepID=UPI0013050817|nr:hypothetical protein [Streptomyces sp. ICBB 8177]